MSSSLSSIGELSGGWGGGGGRLFEAGRLLTFSTFRVGAYSRWALIRGWALKRINPHDGIVLPRAMIMTIGQISFFG